MQTLIAKSHKNLGLCLRTLRSYGKPTAEVTTRSDSEGKTEFLISVELDDATYANVVSLYNTLTDGMEE